MEYNFCGRVYDENGTDKKVSMIKIIDNDNNVTFSNATENNKFSMKKTKENQIDVLTLNFPKGKYCNEQKRKNYSV